VFDAHLVSGGIGSVTDYGNIKIVFTKEAETADHYIERAVATGGNGPVFAPGQSDPPALKKRKITVATSDVLEQLIILGQGANRISADALLLEIETARENMRAKHIHNRPVKNNPVISLVDAKTARLLEEMRCEKPKPKR
jgi:predicted RNA-binding protein with PIN domain